MNRYLCGVALVVTFGCLKAVDATVIVDWGGDYVSSNTNLNDRAGNYATPGLGLWIYNGTTRTSPATGYVPPEGKSGTFYWGGYITRGDGGNPGQRDFTNANVTDSASNDYIRFSKQVAGTSLSVSSFVSFLKEDFLNGYADQNVLFEPGSALSVTTNSVLGCTYRLAVLDGTQWYLSDASASVTGTLSLSGTSLLTSQWGAWSPTGGANSRLGDVPATFDVSGSGFSDIQGVGVFSFFSSPTAGSVNLQITSLTFVPEPSTLWMAGLGVAVFWVGFRRRVRA